MEILFSVHCFVLGLRQALYHKRLTPVTLYVCVLLHDLGRPSKNGLPGPVVKILKECVQTLKKSDKGQVFHHPVPPNFRGPKGIYADVIKKPMDLGTVMTQIDTKYRWARALKYHGQSS